MNSLSQYDLILDVGTSAAEGGVDVMPFDLKLPNGKVFPRPGNLFRVNEGTLWNTVWTFSSGVPLDVDSQVGFGDALPDANVQKAATGELNRQTNALQAAAAA